MRLERRLGYETEERRADSALSELVWSGLVSARSLSETYSY
jgi:hypothetical protein